ncbi:hypothetical protein M426DRAFT_317808 [Hypoxylon sp. CI-4A]|nr:hypothetical protein M426DRAFT_317808 [Hypoxylon sp. CI-4A]
MPKTFRDAITCVGKFSVQFLWIDALCIIQDSPDEEDWAKEVKKMASIYANAYLNIAATSSTDSDGVLFLRIGNDAVCPCVIEANWEGPPIGRYLVSVKGGRYISESPLTERELMLAPRVIHFARDQV